MKKESPCSVNLESVLLKCPWHLVLFSAVCVREAMRACCHKAITFLVPQREKDVSLFGIHCASFSSCKKCQT